MIEGGFFRPHFMVMVVFHLPSKPSAYPQKQFPQDNYSKNEMMFYVDAKSFLFLFSQLYYTTNPLLMYFYSVVGHCLTQPTDQQHFLEYH